MQSRAQKARQQNTAKSQNFQRSQERPSRQKFQALQGLQITLARPKIRLSDLNLSN